MALQTFLVAVVLLGAYALYKYLDTSRRHRIPKGLKPLPGPKGYPIIGSVPDVPEKNGFIKFADWGKEYGPIYQVNLAGHNHVWISSDQVSKDLLSKKAAIYSDRPHIPALISDNRTSAQYLPLLSRNDGHTRQRKFANIIMRESEKALFHRYPELEAKRMLVELLDEPDRYNHALESFISRVTCRLAWGHSEASDELKQRARELLIGVSPTGALGNKLPFLMALPDWLSPAKAWERRRANTERTWFQTMQDQVVKDVQTGQAAPSWMKIFLDGRSKWGFKSDLEGAYAVGMHGIAGALTIAAPMQTFCLAMTYYPQYLPMLQEELDRVCGDRLPRSEDRPNLPFLRAIIRECIRWRPPVPTGIPHYLIQDDEYNGYHIPKGSTMHPLEWAISRDPEMFPDPETFNPLRWVEPGWPTYQEPLTQFPTIINSSQFGYGRRTCQGQTVADEDMLIGIGSIAWLFNIERNAEDAPVPARGSEKGQHSIGLNEKASISNEELNAGVNTKAPTLEEKLLSKYSYPGSAPAAKVAPKKATPAQPAYKPLEWGDITKKPADPTLDYSILLIAKPIPFKFQLKPRSTERANQIRTLFQEDVENGEFTSNREYWGPNQGRDKPLGWSKFGPFDAGGYMPALSAVVCIDTLFRPCSCGMTCLQLIPHPRDSHTSYWTPSSSCPQTTTPQTSTRTTLQCSPDKPTQLIRATPAMFGLRFTASRTQIASYLFGVALFSISFLVFLNSSISFVITQRIGQSRNVGDAVGTLGFVDELVALVACPAWGLLSDRVGVRSVAVMGYTIVGIALWVFVQARNVYPELLLARVLFSLGGSACATMVTAILPSMTVVKEVRPDPRSPTRRPTGRSHALAPSISSELTITPDRFRSSSRDPVSDAPAKTDTGASTSQLAGLVGVFTGCGALVALFVFLPLPTRFQRAGESPASAVADAFYVVGAVSWLVALGCFFGLRKLPGEESKGWKGIAGKDEHKTAGTHTTREAVLSYPRLFLESVRLGFRSPNIGLAYVGGFVARASSVAVSLFIPLFTNHYFLQTGKCTVDPTNPSDIKHACPQAYKLAAMLTGISQLIALMCAPLFGYLSGRFPRYNIPLLVAAVAGIAGYSAFGSLTSPDYKSEEGTGAIFFIVALLGISQIGAIVCSLALLGRGINNDESSSMEPTHTSTSESANETPHLSTGTTPLSSAPITPVDENAPLLPQAHSRSASRPMTPVGPQSHNHIKGSIAGTYSLLGGFGILLLTKAGGALFDSSGPGAPFYMMAAFNAVLLVVVVGVNAWQTASRWTRH
ncbi:cytochrome P450 [Cucurbitaria berberidis CBS 394.84]|uniref:Cytochrome P450 n=1 Tax=Cucurbitaria berberidis CBS 394.84 TaxID=1168544 RepID=A0A9P4GA51_9PLEO|nr:cytochrome P450 [Cucurbitaria berberidis CBS 394.84]KAF1841816.1 cytochrome P450 [Cucurbitaria berberidis CBS 394.84]